jgi:imidazolonepropionase-like amidohydrolase
MHAPSIRRMTGLLLTSSALAVAPLPPGADHHVILLRAEKVIVRPGEVLENAQVLVVDGRIAAVGTDLTAPEGAEVVDGKVVCAGFLDPWSSLGVTSGSLKDTRADAATRTVDGLDPYGSELAREEARAAGVLVVRVQAGTLASISGYGAWCSTGPGTDLGSLVLLDDATQAAMVGLSSRGTVDVFDRISAADKVGENVRSGLDYGYEWVKYEGELAAWKEATAKAETELEKDFKKAKKDRDKDIEEAEEDGKEFKEKKYKEDKKPSPPKHDAEKAALARVANGEVPLVVECYRAAELRALLAGTAGFDRLRLVIAGGTEALAVADQLAARRIPVIVNPVPLGAGRPDHLAEHDLSLAARLAEEGVPVLLGSGGGPASRDLPLLAATAIGHGLDAEEAFAALTYRAARLLDVADQVGSVQRGRRADLLVLSGEPLALTTSITHVLVGGQVVVAPEEDQ